MSDRPDQFLFLNLVMALALDEEYSAEFIERIATDAGRTVAETWAIAADLRDFSARKRRCRAIRLRRFRLLIRSTRLRRSRRRSVGPIPSTVSASLNWSRPCHQS